MFPISLGCDSASSFHSHLIADIQEYLLLKGVKSVAIHSSKCCFLPSMVSFYSPPPPSKKAQEEHQYTIKSFKSDTKDVMVVYSITFKGLDFNDIQQVIIFSMSKEIEDYVDQIVRMGRSSRTRIAMVFVNMSTPEQMLLDLKYLLMEVGQKCIFLFKNV